MVSTFSIGLILILFIIIFLLIVSITGLIFCNNKSLQLKYLNSEEYNTYLYAKNNINSFKQYADLNDCTMFKYEELYVDCWHEKQVASIHNKNKCLFSPYFKKESEELYDLFMSYENIGSN